MTSHLAMRVALDELSLARLAVGSGENALTKEHTKKIHTHTQKKKKRTRKTKNQREGEAEKEDKSDKRAQRD